MEKISVIMPLYNAARYLPEALQSVLKQTYGDFELICINDCSTDDTAKILSDFQRKDGRIKIVVNKERLGAGPSRNEGLRIANGDYVIFLDGDDIFDEGLLEKASMAMETYQADVVMFEALHVPGETIYTHRVIERSDSFIQNYCRTTFSVRDFGARDFPDWSNAPWDKMFRRDFLEHNQLEFQDLPSSNDVYFATMALFCAKKIIWLDDRRVMVYVRDHFEPSRISNDRDPMCAYYALEKIAEEFFKRNMFREYAEAYYCILVWNVQYLLENEKNKERKKSFYCFLKTEGILKCIQYGGEYYHGVDCYYRHILERILNSTSINETVEIKETYFQYYLKKKGQAVLKFVKEQTEKGRKIVLWGIGINGQSLLDYLDEHSVRIFGIVDMDRSKQGNLVNGYQVLNPIDIYQTADLIITTSKQVLWAVKDRTDNMEIKRIDALELMKGER